MAHYEEKVAHVSFNLNKVKTLRWLKQGLDKAMLAYEENKEPLKNKSWVAAIAKK
jgi:hypothetical protein